MGLTEVGGADQAGTSSLRLHVGGGGGSGSASTPLPPAGSYYLTTTYGALEHIKNYDKITVTRQLSVEVQDSIHRWERRRTLNKARASRSSVQVRPGTERVGGGTGEPCSQTIPTACQFRSNGTVPPSLPVCAGLGAGEEKLRAGEEKGTSEHRRFSWAHKIELGRRRPSPSIPQSL